MSTADPVILSRNAGGTPLVSARLAGLLGHPVPS